MNRESSDVSGQNPGPRLVHADGGHAITGLLARQTRFEDTSVVEAVRDRLTVFCFGAIGWPWLLKSLYGGGDRQRADLLARLQLPGNALPALGSWRADAGFLRCVTQHIFQRRPKVIVEFGAGASTVVAARALELSGGGQLWSFDEHADFVRHTQDNLMRLGLPGQVRAAPLTRKCPPWGGRWYQHGPLPDQIDMMIVDGPHWALHPFARGAAETLFARLSVGGVVLLDDADRPGERVVASRWRRTWPSIAFERRRAGGKGVLVGVRTS